MLMLYRALTWLLTPLLPLLVLLRRKKGKEHPSRYPERYGWASEPRPPGALIWIHGASVGEALSALPLLKHLLSKAPHLHCLFTTGTVTSAHMLATKAPENTLHQFIPYDSPLGIARFLRHWHPDLVLWFESEIWPNLILQTHQANIPMLQINARMTARSHQRWQRFPGMIHKLLRCFERCLPRTREDAERFRHLGAPHLGLVGDLKAAAGTLPAAEGTLQTLQQSLAEREIWLAASVHGEEDQALLSAHKVIAQSCPQVLTIVVPRHPNRGADIAALAEHQGLVSARRAAGDGVKPETDIYIADTLGELGLFYRLAPITFIGGSLFPHGGQNPLEAARLATALLFGPHMHNFTSSAPALLAAGGATEIHNADELAAAVLKLWADPIALQEQRQAAKNVATALDREGEVFMDALLDDIEPWLQPLFDHAPPNA